MLSEPLRRGIEVGRKGGTYSTTFLIVESYCSYCRRLAHTTLLTALFTTFLLSSHCPLLSSDNSALFAAEITISLSKF